MRLRRKLDDVGVVLLLGAWIAVLVAGRVALGLRRWWRS